jgi:methyl-accepting chemotaxis protein
LQDQVERVSGYSGELSDGVMELSGATEETAASLKELRTTLQNTLANSENGQSLSIQGTRNAEVGLESVRGLLAAMGQLKTASAQLRSILEMIGEIGNVTSVIDDIVFQTKLLAFNASIEAERAGEHGRGFAVVAAEVGKLANQSGGSATSIRELLVSSESRTKEFITELSSRVDECNAVADKCGVVFNEISQNLVNIRERSNDIAIASREQSEGVAQISEAINQIETSTGRANESAQTLAQTSRDLSEIYRILLGQVVSLESILRGGRAGSHQVAELDTAGGASISMISEKVDQRAA